MLIYELPASSLSECPAQPNVFHRKFFEPHDQMLYNRIILESKKAYRIPAGTATLFIVDGSKKPPLVWTLSPNPFCPSSFVEGIHVGFRKMKRFDQTPYKLPPPTPIHTSRKATFGGKGSTFLSKRSDPKCASTPRLETCIPRERSELPMAPVQVHNHLCRLHKSPQPPVQFHNHLCRFSVPCPRASCTDPHVPDPPVQIQCLKSHSHLCRFHLCIFHLCISSRCSKNMCRFQCHKSHSHHYADSTCIRTCADSVSQVPQSPVQIPVSQVPSVTCAESPRTYADSPRARDFGPFGVDRCIRPAHAVSYLQQELRCFTRYPLFLMGISSPSRMGERAPMDLTMPQTKLLCQNLSSLNCIQPMDLSVQ
ncbi:hypothetical protein TNCV_3915501 [Trichonephila clavipes]|nr:hypothetical protein TNCV_3915501 [Trichonephila clavipes]